jgi:hypothetical protein
MWSSILRSIRSGVRVGLVLLVLPVSANAQSGAGSGLSGRVTDISGAPMAGATITVSRPDAGVERTAATIPGRAHAPFRSSTARIGVAARSHGCSLSWRDSSSRIRNPREGP